jgi:hypothetical protein
MHPLLDRDDGMVWYGTVRWEEFREDKGGITVGGI